jgi:putative DNA primase/helicase
MSPALQAALDYARRGWPVFPVSARKVPLTEHGLLDATIDEAQIWEWWTHWPDAVPSIATGQPSGVVAVDVDVRPGVHGPDSLKAIGCTFHPITPTAQTPSGGYHCLFQWPGYEVRNSTGKLGPGLDIRGDGGSLMLPPGPGRS